jgi:Mrp family chromosome partitioning ATPase
MSLNLLLDDPEKPAIWRGPIVNNLIRQLYMDVEWGDLHYLLVDLPPGTSDAPLTVFQSIPLSGAVVVTTPQDLARMIVTKSAMMAKSLNIPLLGLVENMAYSVCSHCNNKEFLFGESRGSVVSKKLDVPFLGSLPIDPSVAELSDRGAIEDYSNQEFYEIVSKLRLQLAATNATTQAMPIAWKMGASEPKTRKFELKPM